MKFFVSALAVASSFLVARSTPLAAPNLEVRGPEVCGYPTTPLIRAVSDSISDRIFTTDPTEVDTALSSGVYVREAVIAYIYSNTTGPNVPNAVPLYRIWDVAGTDHYLTTSWAEVEAAVNDNGYEYQGVTGYVYADGQSGCAGTVPFYRFYYPQTPDHYYTALTSEFTSLNNQGYVNEGITAYVFPSSTS